MNSLAAASAYRAAGEQHDFAPLSSMLDPSVVLGSPLSANVHFTGAAEVLGVLRAAIAGVSQVRLEVISVEPERAVLRGSGLLEGRTFDEVAILEVVEGKIVRIDLFLRPLPAATAFLRAVGGNLAAAERGSVARAGVRAALTPLVGLSGAVDRLVARS